MEDQGAPRVQRIVGQRLREAREAAEWTQTDFGRVLGAYLGEAWTPQVVSQAESGQRRFTAEELFAIASVLGRPLSWFFLPTEPAGKITIGRGEKAREIDAQELTLAVAGSADPELASRRQALLRWSETVTQTAQFLQEEAAKVAVEVLRTLDVELAEQVLKQGMEAPEVIQRLKRRLKEGGADEDSG